MKNKRQATAGKHRTNHHGGVADPEDLDPTPMELPFDAHTPTPLSELMAAMVVQELDRRAEQEGHETFEEADDFEEEDPDTLDFSAYELNDMQEEFPTQWANTGPVDQDGYPLDAGTRQDSGERPDETGQTTAESSAEEQQELQND